MDATSVQHKLGAYGGCTMACSHNARATRRNRWHDPAITIETVRMSMTGLVCEDQQGEGETECANLSGSAAATRWLPVVLSSTACGKSAPEMIITGAGALMGLWKGCGTGHQRRLAQVVCGDGTDRNKLQTYHAQVWS